MVVVMRSGASDGDVDKVVHAISEVGGEAFVSRGRHQTIIGLVGDLAQFAELPLHAFPGVEDVIRVSKPYKLVSTETHPRPSTVWVGHVPIGRDTVTLIAGPCAIETEDQTDAACRMAKEAGASILRGGAYKPRTSPYAFQGLGEAGLDILHGVSRDLDLPFVTEVVTPADVEMMVATLIQQGLMHGFIAHGHARFAIIGAKAKGPVLAGWPNVWQAIQERRYDGEFDPQDVPGWVRE
jgi:3-deoxy-7-phosphoheptulonate synthase